jgi:hypothetical protein
MSPAEAATRRESSDIASEPTLAKGLDVPDGDEQGLKAAKDLTVCLMCDTPATIMCAACGPHIRYCTRTCQNADWPNHSATCKAADGTHPAPRLTPRERSE